MPKVLKGLETPLLVYRMEVSDFYRLLFCCVGGAFYLLISFLALTRAGSIGVFLLKLICTALMLIGLRIYYTWKAKANRRRYQFRRRRMHISNHDLLRFL